MHHRYSEAHDSSNNRASRQQLSEDNPCRRTFVMIWRARDDDGSGYKPYAGAYRCADYNRLGHSAWMLHVAETGKRKPRS